MSHSTEEYEILKKYFIDKEKENIQLKEELNLIKSKSNINIKSANSNHNLALFQSNEAMVSTNYQMQLNKLSINIDENTENSNNFNNLDQNLLNDKQNNELISPSLNSSNTFNMFNSNLGAFSNFKRESNLDEIDNHKYSSTRSIGYVPEKKVFHKANTNVNEQNRNLNHHHSHSNLHSPERFSKKMEYESLENMDTPIMKSPNMQFSKENKNLDFGRALESSSNKMNVKSNKNVIKNIENNVNFIYI